jgi:hypothetical protein
MILVEFGIRIPRIKRYSNNGNVTVVVNFGLLKLTWLNAKLSALFMSVIGMGLSDIENIANHDVQIAIMQKEFDEALNTSKIQIGRLNNCIEGLQQSIHDLVVSQKSKPSKKSKKAK